MKRFHILSAGIIAIIATSCSSSTADTAAYSINIAPADSSAYRLGQQNAQSMLQECHNTNQIRDRLLEIRARETSIRTRISPSSADAFIYGFRTYLTESGDTLANTIF